MSKFVIPAGEGKSVWLGSPDWFGVDFKIEEQPTGGWFSVVEHPMGPGVLVPPHLHTREDEYSYVLEGEIGARIGDEEVHATTGCYVLKPRNIWHTFWNPDQDRPGLSRSFPLPASRSTLRRWLP